MTSTSLIDSRNLIPEHQAVLRQYARRAVLHDEALADGEEADKDHRMKEFLAMGAALKLTEREMMDLVFGGLLTVKRGCDCPTCRSRPRV